MASTDTPHYIGPEPLSLEALQALFFNRQKLALSDEARRRIQACRQFLEDLTQQDDKPVYGINTGFGSLYSVSIEGQDLSRLQENLVRSHACGTGASLDPELVRLMLFLKVQSLSYGHSGVRLALVERLIAFYNEGILPRVYEQGSLGASGDLAPLAHLSLALLGEGEVWYQDRWQRADQALTTVGLTPLRLQAKEGLALLNGTQFMLAHGLWGYFKGQQLQYQADLAAALSLEAYDGRPEPFDERLHEVRPQPGQKKVAARIRGFLEGSTLLHRPKEHVQDPYSLRCVPQVHGATLDAMQYVAQVLHQELNGVTDNPTLFPEQGDVLSGGNFHGQPLALALDHLALALAELGSISERRTYLLVSGTRGLPPFLVARPGLHSGLMIPQYTAASVVSQNKQLCTPATADSITSSNGQEDHVSMGANAATKLLRVVDNLHTILAIEYLTASQALFFREGATSPFLTGLLERFRRDVPFLDSDRVLSHDIQAARRFLRTLQVEPTLL
ncbi:MAG: histidine ammonia-lyase [Schleiferiaceae bacterium]|nr:histidine ammonia-lyase [Schleiferiaceae bacterium]